MSDSLVEEPMSPGLFAVEEEVPAGELGGGEDTLKFEVSKLGIGEGGVAFEVGFLTVEEDPFGRSGGGSGVVDLNAIGVGGAREVEAEHHSLTKGVIDSENGRTFGGMFGDPGEHF